MNKKILLLFIIYVILQMLFIFNRGVWAPDEARYARVAYEMKEKGSFLIPYLNGDIYKEKPPLFFDITILLSAFSSDIPHYSVKFVSLISSILVAILMMAFSTRCGLKSPIFIPLILFSDLKFFWQAQFGQIDMLLCLFVIAQLYIGYLTLEEEKYSLNKVFLLSFFTFLAIFSKGPAGVIPVYLTLVIYFLFTPFKQRTLRLLPPILISIFFVLIWLYLAGLNVGFDYPKALLFKQTVTRYIDPWHHYAPFYYYFAILWADGFPFIILLLPLILDLIKKKDFTKPQYLIGFIFIITYLVFFSVTPGKRSVYILPIYPVVAMLLSFYLEDLNSGIYEIKKIAFFLSTIPIVLLGVIFVILKKLPGNMMEDSLIMIAGLVLFIFVSILVFILILKKKIIYPHLITIGVFCFIFMSTPMLKIIDSFKVPYEVSNLVNPMIDKGLKVGVYPSLIPSFNYYIKKNTPVFEKSEILKAKKFLSEGNLLLTKEGDFNEEIKANTIVIWRGNIGDSKYLLLAWKEG